MAEIILYQNSNFGGRSVDLTSNSANLGTDYNFNDQTSSIRVVSGTWLLYKDAGFASTCWILTPGEYSSPGTWGGSNDSISSLRALPGNYGDHYAILFRDSNYGGQMVSFTQSQANFNDIGFNDAASSAIVLGGSWSLYKDVNFSGQSWIIASNKGPNNDGRYPSYSGFWANDSVSSIQPL
ncbi:hypothetical protein DK842_16425 [Chromobacterium phragmitis]|uniref:Beta/gamma crystallin-related protein n=1 Tax=Chromobacterium phragmitis TaxID=2202141 RepID=A0A344UN79_9NEIS|nr:beta/gamma crystallin-related protein [Chromobacterium phragmitis]AXE31345.1 hypothetical protein DK842_16425 [Chromobacterium phragmitis]AXE36727.1 hypothetical protein DK843_21950 [Chromobacterium phragmitis]